MLLLSNQREPSKRALEELVAEYGKSREAEWTEAALHWKNGEQVDHAGHVVGAQE